MVAHKNRSGALLVCYFCKSNDCASCVMNDDVVAEVVVCHCTKCQPTCSREACQPQNIKGKKRKVAAPVCPRCTASHPGEC